MTDAAMIDAPDVSILMVNWNTREMTLECLRSVYAETKDTRIEVIMIDNASADGSAEAIRAEFPQVRLVAEDANHGFAKATNMAADIALGKYFLLLNTDTVVLDGAIDKLCAFALKTPEAGMWGGRTLFGDRTLNRGSCYAKITPWSAFCMASGLAFAFDNSPTLNPEVYGNWQRDSERDVDIVSGCFLLTKATLWRELGGFDVSYYMYGEEADLCARARAKGTKPRVTPTATIIHYGGASTKQFSKRICYVLGSRIGLMNRYFPAGWRYFGRKITVLGAGWRAATYSVANLLGKSSAKENAHEWADAWRKRHLWENGPVSGPL